MDQMKLLDLLLDVDGILGNFVDPALDEVAALTGLRHQHDDVTKWDIMECLGIPDDVADAAYARMKREGFCASIPVYPGAQDGVELLRSVCNIYIVTSPLGGPYWSHEREAWLWEHFRIPGKTVISTAAKYKCVGDVFVDDKNSNLQKWQAAHPQGCAVRWNVRSNSDEPWAGLGTNNWHELRGIVVGLSHARSVR
jgi:5'(3')-deoxyribonucleotidase